MLAKMNLNINLKPNIRSHFQYNPILFTTNSNRIYVKDKLLCMPA